MDSGRGTRAHSGQLIAFEDVQHLKEGNASGRGRWHRQDLVAAIGALDWRAADGSVPPEVLPRDESAVCLHLAFERFRGGPFVEPRWAFVADSLQGRRQDRPAASLDRPRTKEESDGQSNPGGPRPLRWAALLLWSKQPE